MKKDVSNWIDSILNSDIPDSIVAFCFNLYEEDEGNYSMELVGTDWFDLEDQDWACNEITDFGSRENRYEWKMDGDWEDALACMVNELTEYLANGKYSELLKSSNGVGTGFVDGNIEILYSKSE